MSYQFFYSGDDLFIESFTVQELASAYGTPIFIYSEARLRENIHSLKNAAARTGKRWNVSYAVKANSNQELLRIIASEGLGASVVSGGELIAALRAGFPANKITFDGPGKTTDEIILAIKSNIKAIVVESEQELNAIGREAKKLSITVNVVLRVNPHVDAKTHPYISTGLLENKFGIDVNEAAKIVAHSRLPSVKIVGLHAHIGSQITELSPFSEAAESLAEVTKQLRDQHGAIFEFIGLGGGQGVRYHNVITDPRLPNDTDESEKNIPLPDEYFNALTKIFDGIDIELIVEPGRAIIADTCILVTNVLYTKSNSHRRFAIVDAGMNDLIRPSLYKAYHQIVPVRIGARIIQTMSIVGPICETGDFFAQDREFQSVERGENLAIMCAGAYGFALSSNYNLRPRAA
ncbi:MAG TPA: diaminopimelate decarboxylase, partial [Candidatus Kapabacteria bacterium]|nr:diaminopimelate decarboxylase [Candidatus Kapabacteria bacterium]